MTAMNAVAPEPLVAIQSADGEVPMATEVKLPKLGEGMESGTIVRWLKAEGESVTKREPLYELDTDKVTQEVESDLDGVLLKIVVAEGEVEVGATIAVIEPAGRRQRPATKLRRRHPRSRRAETATPAPAPADGGAGRRTRSCAGRER